MGRNHFVTTVDIKNFLFLFLRAKKYARTLILTTITMRLYKMFLYQKIMSDSEMAYNGSNIKVRFPNHYHIAHCQMLFDKSHCIWMINQNTKMLISI